MERTYNHLAHLYDVLQKDIDPAVWADHIQRLENQYSLRSAKGDGRDGRPILLDLGCGTGSFCLEMARRGYDPIGIDASPEMLDQARIKAQAGQDESQAVCLFLLQDISRFELFGTVDLAVCLLDTINHLIRPAQVRRLFNLCANYLNPGAVLIFDLATEKHLATTLSNNLFFNETPEYSLFWQNRYRPKTGISTSDLTLFARRSAGGYERRHETIRERHYCWQDIRQWLLAAGLEPVGRHGGLSLKKPAASDERHFFVARRPLPAAKQAGGDQP